MPTSSRRAIPSGGRTSSRGKSMYTVKTKYGVRVFRSKAECLAHIRNTSKQA